MKVVHKFPLVFSAPVPGEPGVVRLPAEVRFRSAGFDGLDRLCVWCEVERDAPLTRDCLVVVLATGDEVPAGGATFLATIFPAPLVWHLYALPSGAPVGEAW